MSVKSDVWSLGVLLVEMLQGTIHGRRVGGRVGAGQSFDVNYLLLQQTTAFDGAATACSPDGSFPVTLPADLNESCFHELLRRMLVVDPLSRADCGELLRGAHVEEIRKLASDDADRAAREYASASQNLKEMKAEAERAQREASMCNLQAIRATAELEEANTRVSRLTAERDALRNALLEAQRTADASSRSDFETQLCHAEDNLRHALDLVSAAKRELDLAIARRVDAMGLMDRSQWELSQAELNVRRLTESESGVRSMMDASLLRSFRSYRTERDAAVAQVQSERVAEVARLQTERDRAVAQVQSERVAEVARLQTERDRAVAQVQSERVAEVALLQTEHDAEVARVQSVRVAAVARLQTELAALRSELETLRYNLRGGFSGWVYKNWDGHSNL